LQQLNTSLSDVQIAFKEKKIGDVVKLNTYFHEFIISICENHRLKRMMKNINSLTLLYRNAYFNKYFGNDDFLKEHHEILKAMASRSPELASQKMETHILNDMNYLKHQFSV
jgi:DNA-binding GntR family transcriptional regulator